MKASGKVAIGIACLALICGATIVWRVHKRRAIEQKKVADAIGAYRVRAENGDDAAQYRLAYMFHEGKGVPKDYGEAVRWARKAADQGNAKAQSVLGHTYSNGEGVPRDYAESVRWYRKAAEQGYALAQQGLAYLYANGEGVPQDKSQAVVWYRKAAEQGDAVAEQSLGYMYANGRGLLQNYAGSSSLVSQSRRPGLCDRAVRSRKHVPQRGRGATKLWGSSLLVPQSR